MEPEQQVNDEVESILATEEKLQNELTTLETALSTVPEFQAFLEKQAQLRDAQTESSEVWARVEAQMIEHNIKSIKGDWGSITIAERNNFKAADLDTVPRKFIKRTLDTTKVSSFFKLENKLPAGIEHTTTKYLTKRLKGRE